MVAMIAKLTVDKVGRILLPKPFRDQLELAPGRPIGAGKSGRSDHATSSRGTAQLRKQHGVWVFHCGEPLSTSTVEETIAQVRRERDERNLGQAIESALRHISADPCLHRGS
jgi:bifunctional DNA-binding transcriptional regulator/antitoxin component of YhaV-PrlF toxin-antitoxin module